MTGISGYKTQNKERLEQRSKDKDKALGERGKEQLIFNKRTLAKGTTSQFPSGRSRNKGSLSEVGSVFGQGFLQTIRLGGISANPLSNWDAQLESVCPDRGNSLLVA